MEDYKIYLKKFKIAVSILGGAVVLGIFLIAQTVPVIQNITNIQNEYKSQSDVLADTERKLENLRKSENERKVEEDNIVKAFFKPISGGSDTETAIADEFGEILQLMRTHKIKTRSIKYDYDPQDDNFVKNVAHKYHVCRVTADMIASYSDFESFLRELYKHDHFLDISKIEIVPYQKNKRILLVNMQIKLYAQKDASAAAESAPKANKANNAPQNSTGDNQPPNLGQN